MPDRTQDELLGYYLLIMSIQEVSARDVERRNLPKRKLIILGKTDVGKSSIILRATKHQFDPVIRPTLAAACCPWLEVTIGNGSQHAILVIWDTAGQEEYYSLGEQFYRDAKAALVVYDVSVPDSLEVAKQYIRELDKREYRDLVIALVGNKSDLPSAVDAASAQQFATQNGYLFAEVSAKTGHGIEDIFLDIASRLMDIDSGIEQSLLPGLEDALVDLQASPTRRDKIRRGCSSCYHRVRRSPR